MPENVDLDAQYAAWLAEVTVGPPQRLTGPVEIAEHEPGWAGEFERLRAAIEAALGSRALRLEHVGSTSVPGLAAKPLIDIILEVSDAADETAYVPILGELGYALAIREPSWFEHRLLKRAEPRVHLHVFSRDCPETARMLAFRDRLRVDAADRQLYERTKRKLAGRQWTFMQQYADAKTEVIAAIMARAG